MVNFGTPLTSSTFSRVTGVLQRNVVMGNVALLERRLLELDEQLSTGLRLLRPSVDPVAARRVLDFQSRLNETSQHIRNIESSLSRFEVADKTMEDLGELISQARTILLEQVQSTATTQTRQISAAEIDSMLQRVIAMGNERFEGRYLYGGSATVSPPIATYNGQVAFRGDSAALQTAVSPGLTLASNVVADDIFGVFSDEIRGLETATLLPIDLNPALVSAAPIGSLNGGRGVTLGQIQVSGIALVTIDLSIADTVGDLIDLINTASVSTGVTASINATLDGIRLSSTTGALRVIEISGGRTAAELGIYTGVPVASPFSGADINPALIGQTRFGDFFGGAGISLSGITILQEIPGQILSNAFSITSNTTVEQFLNTINTGNTFSDARINEGATGIDVVSRLSGGRMRILENGGTTAAQLGLLYTAARAKLADLNGGRGIASVPGADFQIARKDGVVVSFDADAATFVQELVDLIDADPGLTAFVSTSGRIYVSDVTGGAGPLSISDVNGSYAATNLGIAGTTAGTVISGTALSFEGVQVEGIYTALIRLRDALLAGDVGGIAAADRLLRISEQRAQVTRASAGARAAAFDLTRNRLETEKLQLEIFISKDRDVDFAEASSQFQQTQTILQAALLVASRILQISLLNFL
jgi:flagellin-like hook-associated protein FlgL